MVFRMTIDELNPIEAFNDAILEQQAVLQWVQRNAAAFGGDPTRVALGGQSAGASNTGR